MKVFLDTNALMALSGLPGTAIANTFVAYCQAAGIVLCVSHIQVDEKIDREMSEYHARIEKAIRELKELGLNVVMEPTTVSVYGVSRVDMSRIGGKDENELYRSISELVSACDLASGKKGDATRDAITGVSALDHDLFLVCDECLFRSFKSATTNLTSLQDRLPKIMLRKPSAEDVANGIISSDFRIIAAVARAKSLFTAFISLLLMMTTVLTVAIFLPPIHLSQNFVLGLVTLDGLLVTSSAAIVSVAVGPLRDGFKTLRSTPQVFNIAVQSLGLPIIGRIPKRRATITRLFLNVGEFIVASFGVLPPLLAAVLALAASLRLDQSTGIFSVPGVLVFAAVWLTIWHAIFLLPYLAWTIYSMRTMTTEEL